MKSRRMRYIISALLFVQLIAATSADRPVEARHRSLGSSGVVSRGRLPEPSAKQLSMNRMASIYSPNASDQLMNAQLNSGILLTGRRWPVMTLDDRLLWNNPIVTKGYPISDCRSFLVGHLIKNAYAKPSRLQSSGER